MADQAARADEEVATVDGRREVMDPGVIRVLLRLRESVAAAYERAYRELAEAGLWTPDGDPLPRPIALLLAGSARADTSEPREG